MKAVLQRVSAASVAVDGKIVGECKAGLMILLGVAEGDTERDAELLAAKILKLRIFNDENGKMISSRYYEFGCLAGTTEYTYDENGNPIEKK